MRRPKCIKQQDISDCGVAALASVAAWFGLRLPITRIRTFSATTKEGTTVQSLLEAAEQIGFSAKGLRAPASEEGPELKPLYEIPKPSILHLLKPSGLLHFVVLYRSGKKNFTIMDPADGRLHKLNPEELRKEWTGILILLAPNHSFVAQDLSIGYGKRIRELIKHHRSDLTKALIGSMIYTLIGLCSSLFVQQVVDRILPDANLNLLHLLGCIMLVLIIFSLFISFFRSLLLLRTGLKTDARLIMGYYQHLLHLPQSFFDQRQSGELISRINDAFKIRAFITDSLIQLAICIFSLLFAACLMFTYYWKLALISFVALPLYAVIYYIFDQANKGTQRKAMAEAAQMEATLVEALRAERTLKYFNAEPLSVLRTENNFIQLARTLYKAGTNALWAGSSGEAVSRLLSLLLLWSGSYFVLNAQLSAGALLSFYTLIGYFSGPITQLIGMNLAFRNARIAAERLFEITDLETEGALKNHPIAQEDLGDIAFENISFHYPGRKALFKDFSLRIPKAQITAIAGESGSGKSSLAGLLMQLYSPQEGVIRIGNLNLSQLNPHHWRQHISIVPQKIDLFSGTLLDNIALGDPMPDMRKALFLCHQMGLGSFIDTLPHGLSSTIGEQGLKLSGGQQQRIAFARALYRKPSVLILDEACSSLDSDAEAYIQKAILQLKAAGRTIILIAHRVSSLLISDRIIVLQEGRIIEEGTHQELLSQGGRYTFWNKAQLNMK